MWGYLGKYREMSTHLHEKHVKFIRSHMQMCISNNSSAMKIQLNRLLIPCYGDHDVRIVLGEYRWGFTRDRGIIDLGFWYKKFPIAPNMRLVLMK